MTNPNPEIFLIGGAIGLGLMLAGLYGLRQVNPPMTVRLTLGAILSALGIGALFFWPGLDVLVSNAVYLGFGMAVLALGINQLGAPLRRALGKSV